MSLRLLSDAVPRVAGKVFSRKYIMLGRLVSQWPNIVGQELAGKSHPVKIRYRKVPGADKAEAALDVETTTADATLLHYRVGVMLERINQIFGEQIVTAIRFVPVSSNEKMPGLLRTSRRRKPVSPSEQAEMAKLLEHVDDTELKTRLETLGASILQDS